MAIKFRVMGPDGKAIEAWQREHGVAQPVVHSLDNHIGSENLALLRVFPPEGYAKSYAAALTLCRSANHRPLFLPEVAYARINSALPWDKWFDSISVRVTGKSKSGEPFVLYVHEDHPLSTVEGLQSALSKGLVNGAAHFPQEAFWELLDHDGEKADDGLYRVKAVPHGRLRKSSSGVISIDDALEHPQTVPFSGSEDLAKQYLAAFRKAYGTDKIGIWHSDDLHDDGPLARPLFVGGSYDLGLDGDDNFDISGRFVGVPRAVGEQGARGASNGAERR